ncbi:MAG TPA: GTPase Era [Halanaerobiales bacterium]|nr:GTPase Era [Halanaerobiales bacterium]
MIIFLLDATSAYGKGDDFILRQLKGNSINILPVLNKTDSLDLPKVRKRLEEYSQAVRNEVIPVSALKGDNIQTLLEEVFLLLPEGPKYYPEEMYTNQIEQFIIAEIIREKIFFLIREEVPYGIAVLIEEIKERKNGVFYIRANIYTEKKSHKGILIGKSGSMLKKIGLQARKDIERLLQTDVYLDLWVKVLKNWREKEALIKRMGYKGW